MKKLIVFYKEEKNNHMEEVCGGDSIITPDQRYSILSLVKKIYSREICRPSATTHFAICCGDIFNYNRLTSYYKL